LSFPLLLEGTKEKSQKASKERSGDAGGKIFQDEGTKRFVICLI
jgi:hypothetical protein